MKLIKFLIVFFLFWNTTQANDNYVIKGSFSEMANKDIYLKGFTMEGDSLISATKTDSFGKFSIQYPSHYYGAALLEIKDSKSVIILLHHENFEILWENIEDFKTLKFKYSPENEALEIGLNLAQNSENKLAALNYLKPLYEKDPAAVSKIKWITTEIEYQNNAFFHFLNGLPKNSYAYFYIKLRKLLQNMPITASKKLERLADHEKEFKAFNFADSNLIHSGLYKELLEGYFKLLESAGPIDTVALHTNASTDVLLHSLDKNPILKQNVAEYLFRLFEKRSLFNASEHLALAMLNSQSCEMDSKHEALFEQYRKMAKGKIAPTIVFENATKPISNLSDIKSKYRLIVFGASWCNKCQEEIPKLIPYYKDWSTNYDLEIVFISLDTEKEKFNAFVSNFPWLSSCELKGWESIAAIDYCVFGTPTMYLLNNENTILLKPISEKQIQAWLEMTNKNKT